LTIDQQLNREDLEWQKLEFTKLQKNMM
jgi:hypothetical protein